VPADEVLARLATNASGLTDAEAARRLATHGPNLLRARRRTDTTALLGRQFKSPIVLILLVAAVLSVFLRDPLNGAIILAIVLASSLLGFWQERRATDAVEKLLAMVRIEAAVLRGGRPVNVPLENVVPGDVLLFNAGDIIAGDSRILASRDLSVDQAALTGETFPADKGAGVVAADAPLPRRSNALFMGTHVMSGTATAVVVETGRDTEFGRVAERLETRPAETEFEQGVRRFGYFLLEVTLLLVIAIFAINVYLDRPTLDAFLFPLALAVGLTPQLLPAIISINLAHGARRMAQERVIVKRLAAIENVGSMNVLCADKTGTLTEGPGAPACDPRSGRHGERAGAPVGLAQLALRERLRQPP
jgi:P-type Mg2+ transporter